MGMEIEIMVTDPAITFIESISCISAKACKGMTIAITKQGASALNNLEIGMVECGQFESCMDMRVDLGQHVTVLECHCAGGNTNSCQGLVGVEGCVTAV